MTDAGFLEFINSSPTPYHAVAASKRLLEANGYKSLSEKESWSRVQPGGKYYVTRNTSSIIAFSVGPNWTPGNGLAIVGAHTDSPTLRLKPKSAISANGYVEVGVEVYGGGLWPTWFDRDLSVAGRVYHHNPSTGRHEATLVHIKKPLLRIPTLAIHLHREQSSKLEFNKEEQLRPILGLVPESAAADTGDHPAGLMALLAREVGTKVEHIDDFELVLYDVQPAQIGGLNDEFIFGPRQDNLNSCWCSLQGLLSSDSDGSSSDGAVRMVALFDHEEIGSVSAQGAASNFLDSVITRLNGGGVDRAGEAIAKSFLVSADMAHAVHPNYSAKHERSHQPRINEGTVIKINANQRYATNSFGVVLLKEAAKAAGVPLQKFVVRNDSPCGSTIGPIMAANIGMRTIDIGNPQLSMHSVREMAGSQDLAHCSKLLAAFFSKYTTIEAQIDLD